MEVQKMTRKRTPLAVVVDRLLAEREVDGRRMNRADLARKMDVAYSSMWEALGAQRPGLPTLQRIAVALDVSTPDLIEMVEREAER